MRRVLIALIAVVSLFGVVAAAPVGAAPPPRAVAVSGYDVSGTRVLTLQCEPDVIYTIEVVAQVRGVKGLGTGTTVMRFQVVPIPDGLAFSGTWTFTSADGLNTLSAVNLGESPQGAYPGFLYDSFIYHPTSGTGRFAQVTGGTLTIGSGPHIEYYPVEADCGRTWVENEDTNGVVIGVLSYNGWA